MQIEDAKQRAELLLILKDMEECVSHNRMLAEMLGNPPPGDFAKMIPGFSVIQTDISMKLGSLLAAAEILTTGAALH